MKRVAAAMTWAATTMRAAIVMTVTVRAVTMMTAKTKPCASLLGRLFLGSCGTSVSFVSVRSMILRPRWCFTP
jgi:hypothetical protein